MADEDNKYLRDIIVHVGPYDPAIDTIVGVKDGEDVRYPMNRLDLGRNKIVDLEIDNAGNVHLDYAASDYFVLEMTRNVDTWTFESMPGQDSAATIALLIHNGMSPKTLAWPGNFRWNANAPLISSTGNTYDLLIITTFDGGVNWLADFARDYKL